MVCEASFGLTSGVPIQKEEENVVPLGADIGDAGCVTRDEN